MLSVWLPLNGDLHNQGLKNISVSSNNSSVSTNGKIGSCMKITSNTDLGYSHDFNTTGVSFGGWFKFNKSEISSVVSNLTYNSTANSPTGNLIGNNYYGGIGLIWTGNNYYSSNNFSSMTIQSILRTSSTIQSTSGFYVDFDVWIHIFLTWDPDAHILNLYKNGVLVSTKTSVEFSDGVTKNILLNYNAIWGGDGPGASIPMYCNDIRIYDHALSPLEVKHLAQGLVLHYPLSMPGQENLLVPQISDNKWTNWRSNSTWDSTNTREKIVGDDGKTWAHIIQNTTAGYGGYTCDPSYNQIVIDSSKRYTLSCIAKAGAKENAEIVLWYHWRSTEGGANLSQSNKKFQLTSNPQRISWTLPQYTNNTYTVNRINLMMGTSGTGNNEIYFTDVKFEEGSRPTPWLPNPADTKYAALGFNDGIEYDVSGYNHNGTKYGVITYDSDTPRYETSTHISATDQYIKVENLDTSGFGNSYTFSWWSKVSTFSNMQWGFSNGVRLNGMYTGKLWNTGDSSNNPLYIPNTTTQVTVPTTNVWHHWVMTGDGTTCRVYQDGELWGIAKTYKSISGTTLCINGWNDTTSYKNSYMIISDFRIYATALSADDVRDLYSVAASISDNGTLMASEVSEV